MLKVGINIIINNIFNIIMIIESSESLVEWNVEHSSEVGVGHTEKKNIVYTNQKSTLETFLCLVKSVLINVM